MELFENKQCLVVGCGSIGNRHADLLLELGQSVAFVTQRTDTRIPSFSDLTQALREWNPELVIVANRTHEHFDTCLQLSALGFTGLALIEKPLWSTLPAHSFTPEYPAFVAYNMRFHPVVRRVKEALSGKRIFSAQLSVGQYLPEWRPGTDYRNCYSAHAEQGGGVLRDLSHELDMALWLFGAWNTVTGRIGRWGDLEISSDDTADIVAECDNCRSLTIHLDYQSRFSQRNIMIQAEDLSIHADLLSGSIRFNNERESLAFERNTSFRSQLRALLSGNTQELCSWEDGHEVARFMIMAEKAAQSHVWEFNT
jgi:Predicted dehydrogenases and related proteins